jgi:hypothetical protein
MGLKGNGIQSNGLRDASPGIYPGAEQSEGMRSILACLAQGFSPGISESIGHRGLKESSQ